MNTIAKQRITVKQFAELVFTLMEQLPEDVDMQIIESAINQVMRHNELRFKPYFELLAGADEKYLISRFDTTADFFFDAINSKGMYLGKVEYLIGLTVKF